MKTPIAALLALVASAAYGQQDKKPGPADPSLRVPRPIYQSAFAGYRPYKEEEPTRWREANDEVRRIGGHADHSKPADKSNEGKKK